jgi:hypothetical protein
MSRIIHIIYVRLYTFSISIKDIKGVIHGIYKFFVKRVIHNETCKKNNN